jgi:hypothetical protein
MLGVYIALGVKLIQNEERYMWDSDYISTVNINQVSHHWVVQPYVDAVVLSRAKKNATQDDVQCPSEYPEFILERLFYGADLGCDCIGVYSKYVWSRGLIIPGWGCDRN